MQEIVAWQKAYEDNFQALFSKKLAEGTLQEKYEALAATIKSEISRKWIKAKEELNNPEHKQAYYFSIEYLPGRLLKNNLFNLGKEKVVENALTSLGINLEELAELEEDPGLGSGGLGRLAAAFLDSLAALNLPGHGFGIRYRYGLFEQKIEQGEQVELPDNWLKKGYPWEYRRDEEAEVVKYGGYIKVDSQEGKLAFIHENYQPVKAVPYDIPILGYENETVNTLRLWNAEAIDNEFNFSSFSRGDYLHAYEHKAWVESISQVLYPDDSSSQGKELRLKQHYLLVSAGLQNIVRQYKKKYKSLRNFDHNVAVHINDTHPALAVPELMRILMDDEGMGWDEAWGITTGTISYTNHTVLPEALEKWNIDLIKSLLPRIYMIIVEINNRFCSEVMHKSPGDISKIREMTIIEDGVVKMANLAIVGSSSVNGVAELHTEILKTQVMNNFYAYYPHKFNNKTNGITHRRWMHLANRPLSNLLEETIGTSWLKRPQELIKLADFASDPAFQEKFLQVKEKNKRKLAEFISEKYQVTVDTKSIFDMQIKRIHAYKRQLLNFLHIMDLYNRLKENPELAISPRTFIFAGKAAPSYYLAKRIIKLINIAADMINKDKDIRDKLKVVFLENYNVSLAELAFPAADVSEQLSAAGKEASGTGNMKFMMNGAVTVGTLDGANIEIREQVGEENFIAFGLTAEETSNYNRYGGYRSWDIYQQDPRVKKLCEQLINGFFSGSKEEFRCIYDYLLYQNDEYFVLKDFSSYAKAQNFINQVYQDSAKWATMCINNIAHSAKFSSDRTISEYAEDIWGIKALHFN